MSKHALYLYFGKEKDLPYMLVMWRCSHDEIKFYKHKKYYLFRQEGKLCFVDRYNHRLAHYESGDEELVSREFTLNRSCVIRMNSPGCSPKWLHNIDTSDDKVCDLCHLGNQYRNIVDDSIAIGTDGKSQYPIPTECCRYLKMTEFALQMFVEQGKIVYLGTDMRACKTINVPYTDIPDRPATFPFKFDETMLVISLVYDECCACKNHITLHVPGLADSSICIANDDLSAYDRVTGYPCTNRHTRKGDIEHAIGKAISAIIDVSINIVVVLIVIALAGYVIGCEGYGIWKSIEWIISKYR